MKFARISNDTAIETATAASVAKLADLFHPTVAAEFVSVPANVEAGWVRVGGNWTAPDAPEPVEVYVPIEMDIIDLLRRFTDDEFTLYLSKDAEARALRPEDFAAALAGDQEMQLLVGFRRFLAFFDSLRQGKIQINHPQTIQGIGALVPLQVLTPERLPFILATS